MTKKIAVGTILILACVFPCEGRSLGSSSPEPGVRLHLAGGRPIVDGVFLNGQGPYRFLLDTGAETNQFDAALARKLQLTATFEVELATAGGTTRVRGGRVAQVTLADVSAAGQEFLFTSLDGVHALSPDIQGVLGQEFLGRFDYLLDFRNRRLTFGAQAPAGEHTPFHLLHGVPALDTSEGEFILDSGTDTTILCRAARGGASGRIRTASGFASAAVAGGVRLRIGDREVRPPAAAFAPDSAVGADGLLPASLFPAVYVSNSAAYVILEQGGQTPRLLP